MMLACDECGKAVTRPPGQWSVSDDEGIAVTLRASCSAPVVLRQIFDDDVCMRLIDWSAKGFDHLVDLGLPGCGVQERRVHGDVVEAVASAAICLYPVEAGRRLERDRLLGGESRGDDRDEREENRCTHG